MNQMDNYNVEHISAGTNSVTLDSNDYEIRYDDKINGWIFVIPFCFY